MMKRDSQIAYNKLIAYKRLSSNPNINKDLWLWIWDTKTGDLYKEQKKWKKKNANK